MTQQISTRLSLTQEFIMNAKLSKQLIATIAFAAISAAGIGSASAADLGYQQYLHNLDAADAVTEQKVDQATVTANSNQDAYNRYLRSNGWIDDTADTRSVTTIVAGGYQAYLHNLDATNAVIVQNVGQAVVTAKSSSYQGDLQN
jgi:hypothetical protein